MDTTIWLNTSAEIFLEKQPTSLHTSVNLIMRGHCGDCWCSCRQRLRWAWIRQHANRLLFFITSGSCIPSCSSLQADLVSPPAAAEVVPLVAEKQITMLPVHQQTHETITHPRQCHCDLCHGEQESCSSVTLCDRSIGCRLYIDPKHWCPCQK